MKQRLGGFWLVSLAIHLVAGAGLIYVLKIGAPFWNADQAQEDSSLPVERIGFLSVPDRGVTIAGRSGGDGRPVSKTPAPALKSPVETPPTLPPPSAAAIEPEGGSGPVVGRGGPTRGVVPSYTDQRLWSTPGPLITAPKTMLERIDSGLVARITAHQDSIAANAPRGRKPGDWTVTRNGKKYGLDQKKIYIGSIEIPSAVLALLPLNVQANPTSLERERALSYMSRDIAFHAARAARDDEFKAAVKRIRERKERERREAEKVTPADIATP
ncbi:MAG: hypothetical protein H7Z74_17585 [Anaerolineae bacterium]|nr:hypothetical protein [Gemmatimonadaceae bacterium]